jgi:hypothetical protein
MFASVARKCRYAGVYLSAKAGEARAQDRTAADRVDVMAFMVYLSGGCEKSYG